MLFNFNNAQISAMYLDVCGQKLPKARHTTIRVQNEIIIAFGTLIFTLHYLFFKIQKSLWNTSRFIFIVSILLDSTTKQVVLESDKNSKL